MPSWHSLVHLFQLSGSDPTGPQAAPLSATSAMHSPVVALQLKTVQVSVGSGHFGDPAQVYDPSISTTTHWSLIVHRLSSSQGSSGVHLHCAQHCSPSPTVHSCSPPELQPPPQRSSQPHRQASGSAGFTSHVKPGGQPPSPAHSQVQDSVFSTCCGPHVRWHLQAHLSSGSGVWAPGQPTPLHEQEHWFASVRKPGPHWSGGQVHLHTSVSQKVLGDEQVSWLLGVGQSHAQSFSASDS
mmetsp:Transcript_3475/g.11374  ORF Transcript_3475/g.11374 Transcript_3475/m.11374 type:complete len:240 (+) Transcript_3475:832-1551(+)